MNVIADISLRIPAKHILFVMDTCYSGLALARASSISPQTPGYLEKIANTRVRQIITAGGAGEQAFEREGHGLFTKHFLEALDGPADENKDGVITGFELGNYLRWRVSEDTSNKQTPVFGIMEGEGEFLFVVADKKGGQQVTQRIEEPKIGVDVGNPERKADEPTSRTELKAEVPTLRKDWKAEDPIPRVIVIIEEKNAGRVESASKLPFTPSQSETTISHKLREYGFSVIDHEFLSKKVAGDRILQIISGNTAEAVDLGHQFRADAIILGTAVVSVGVSNIAGTSMKSLHANIHARVVKTASGEIIVAASKNAAVPHIDMVTGSTRALEKDSEKLACHLIEQLIHRTRQ